MWVRVSPSVGTVTLEQALSGLSVSRKGERGDSWVWGEKGGEAGTRALRAGCLIDPAECHLPVRATVTT